MKTLLTLAFITISSFAIAQNYDCLQTGPRKFFTNGNNYIRGIRIDSIMTFSYGTVYYPYHTIRQGNYLLGSPFTDSSGASWLGKNVVKKSDGTFLFDNMWDTVVIKTQSHTGDSWLFFNDTFHVYYNATVASEDTMSISGTLDSVKKITITSHTTGGAPYTSDPVNNFQLILSKNHGFVQIFDLYTFPYYYPDTLKFNPPAVYSNRQIDMYLDALLGNLGSCFSCGPDNRPNTQNSVFHLINLYNPSRYDIYNFAPGDLTEWHSNVTNPTGTITDDNYKLDTITSVTTIGSSRDIVSKRLAMNVLVDVAFTPIHHDTTYSASTPTFTTDSSKLMSIYTMPEEAIAGNPYMLHYYPRLPLAGLTCDTAASYSFMEIYGFGSNGISIVPQFDSAVYSIGYGRSAHTYYVPYGTYQVESYNYLYKNSNACGTLVPIVPHSNAVTLTQQSYRITISPNPTTDYLHINADMPFSANTMIAVTDMTGRCIYQHNATNLKDITLNTNNWNNGIYYLSIQNESCKIWNEKIVILK